MRARFACALLLLLPGCHKHAVTVQGSETRIDLTLDFPVNGALTDFSGICAGAQSLLISLDADADPGWDYRLLVDPANGDLWGCAGGRCSDPSVHGLLPAPHRVLVEGLSVAPADYASPHDVMCRGMADPAIGMGTIGVSSSPLPSPTPTPSAGDVVKLLVSVHVPMLRIAEMNGTFTNEAPAGRWIAATALDPPGAARTASGGTLVFGGGLAAAPSAAVFELVPAGLAFRQVASLQTARFAATATAFSDSSGRAVLFAGGATSATDALADAEVWRPGDASTVTLPMHAARAFHSAAALAAAPAPDAPAVAITGGCLADRSSPLADTETFSPFLEEPPPAGCASAPMGFCTVPGTDLPTARCHHLTASLADGIWLAGGFEGPSGAPASDSYLLDLPSPPAAAGSLPDELADSATIVTGPGTALFAGGTVAANGANGSRAFGDLRVGRVPTVREDAQMQMARAAPSLTALLDGRLLVTGGSDGGSATETIEIFTPTASTLTNGTFDFVSKPDGGSCNNGTNPHCVKMSSARVAHSALRIDGSAAWVDGAVVIAGGGDTAMPEIFVPAYACSGIAPVSLFGAAMPEVDFCDRARDPVQLTLTDPSAPAPL